MTTQNTPAAPISPKLLDQVHDKIRMKNYSIRTEAQWDAGDIF
jgi:hypothetical protein